MDLAFLVSTFVTLFVIIDPIATVPVFLAMTADDSVAPVRGYLWWRLRHRRFTCFARAVPVLRSQVACFPAADVRHSHDLHS